MRDAPALLKIIQFTDHEDVRQSAKHTISSLAARSKERAALSTALKSALRFSHQLTPRRLVLHRAARFRRRR